MTFPNRDNQTFPDAEQEKREQARNETKFVNGEISERPSFTRIGPDRRAEIDAGAEPTDWEIERL